MIVVLVTFLLVCAISFFCTAGIVWLICWGLTASGLYALTFSWPLALVVWLVLWLVKGAFHVTVKN